MTAQDYIKKLGYWHRGHPKYPVADWQYEVNNGDTRLGYWEWVVQRQEEKETETEK